MVIQEIAYAKTGQSTRVTHAFHWSNTVDCAHGQIDYLHAINIELRNGRHFAVTNMQSKFIASGHTDGGWLPCVARHRLPKKQQQQQHWLMAFVRLSHKRGNLA